MEMAMREMPVKPEMVTLTGLATDKEHPKCEAEQFDDDSI